MLRSDADIVSERYPIVGMEFYNSGIRIIRQSKLEKDPPRGVRMEIAELSKSSLSRLAFLAQNTPAKFASMLTLSYGRIFPSDGVQVKASLNRFLSFLRARYSPMQYLWFLEFQRRGAPHIHILLDHPVIEADRVIIAYRWTAAAMFYALLDKEYELAAIVDCEAKMKLVHAHPRTWENLRSSGGAAGYVTAYATKPKQKVVPRAFHNVGRFWGNSKKARPKMLFSVPANENDARSELMKRGHKMADAEIIPKYISTYKPETING